MVYTEDQVRYFYEQDFAAINSLTKDEQKIVVSKYSKQRLIDMARALYGEEALNFLSKRNRLYIMQTIRKHFNGIDRAKELSLIP
jgi:hypothetical protein